MNKLKKIWRENSILFVLLIILIVCLIAIAVVVLTYFVGDNSSKYGDRLDGIEKIAWSDKDAKEIVSKLEEDEKILDANIKTSGKIIYIKLNFATDVTLVEAESKAVTSLDLFSEEVKGFYDLEYMIEAEATEKSEGFHLMGARNVSGTGGIVWNNNTKVEED